MLDLNADQIAKLNDEDLRELVFKLCEAELRRNNQPIASVTAGGNQTATDGGVDVRVDLPKPVALDFIPRSQTVFQVKCEDMSASKIKKEMCPGGQLRASVVQLIAVQGAYIMVSSQGTVADSRLKERREAMRAAMNTVPDAATVHVDFYDRNRLANWVRAYPGVEQWTRARIGEPLTGWQAYGNWTGDKTAGAYQKDELGRVLSKSSGSVDAMSVENGINAIRDQLAKPGQSVRLIGLSGTDKTRMVQALFESGVGASPLDTSIVVYTDQGLSPQPSAREMMQKLGANGLRVIIVVDNCNPATHQALTQIVAEYPTHLSLITVEYDVMDDEPEETQVFELTGSSPAVLDEILAKHAPHIAQNDRLQIVEFSDGNARVALALAQTVQKGQTLGVLNNNDLFKRLFLQNQDPNEALLRAAEVCSLVYSFDGETLDSADAELPILAALANLQPGELFRQVAELKRRKLVQIRSKWRAVLPHALANRLAKQTLMNLPQSQIMAAFQGHQRLLKSFSRRLGYLHDSPEACDIAEIWMADEKWLANLRGLNELGTSMFLYLAPLVPEQALARLEAAFGSDGEVALTASSGLSQTKWRTLARNLAYEPSLFDRAAQICLAYAVSEKQGNHAKSNIWKELFQMRLSGTLAPPSQRVSLLRNLLSSGTPHQQQMAIEGLESMLNSSYFRSSHHFSFGARPRGYGWEPKSAEDEQAWYLCAFELVVEFAKPESTHSDSIRTSVARHLRSLWVNLGMHDEVATLVRTLAEREGWPRGWAAIRVALRRDSTKMALPHLEMLKELEQLLRPVSLEQNVRAYVLLTNWDIADGENDDEVAEAGRLASRERVFSTVEELARDVAVNPLLLQKLLPDLLVNGSGQQYWFGKGLGVASTDLTAVWQQLVAAFAQVAPSNRDTRLLAGFLEGAHQVDSAIANRLLNAAVYDPILAEYFPLLQGQQWNEAAVRRLLESLAYENAPLSNFDWIKSKYQSNDTGMPESLYLSILLKLAETPDGLQIAMQSLGSTFFQNSIEGSVPSTELVLLGRELLERFNFDRGGNDFESKLIEVAEVCMQGAEATITAINFCLRFAGSHLDYRLSLVSLRNLAETLFRLQPVAALDAFIGDSRIPKRLEWISNFSAIEKSVVNSADVDVLQAWVKVSPAIRAPLLAAAIDIHSTDSHGNYA
ncbi:hypothetical protein MIZ03_3852 [Rhodoferax lithotrophicus]|uniref:Uncharacterized protein n=1 Tax=Rhodoferax lithotrophicus TaxID=2798804 RepID=A0ABM7MRL1_9BURK|nr:hypothetical protein [Rhodoferax sp. MIZ03]BCO28942.1 hypothetical protein MIZ03_3852 [Rhodoferax sp. MIZ03]